MTTKTKAYQGTAQDIGCDVFIQHVMPIIRQASKQMTQQQLAELYAGFMAGACGSMAADFGKDVAQRLIIKFANQFGDVVTQIDQGSLQ